MSIVIRKCGIKHILFSVMVITLGMLPSFAQSKRIHVTQKDLFSPVFETPNTRYIIEEDLDLNGASIKIGLSSILDFQGGVISNGMITGNNTCISAEEVRVFDNVQLEGSFINHAFLAEWFGMFPNDPLINCTNIIESSQLFSLGNISLQFNNGTYFFSEMYIGNGDGTQFTNRISLLGKGSKMCTSTTFAPFEDNQRYIIKVGGRDKDTFGEPVGRVERISILGIRFTNANNEHIYNSSKVQGEYNCGLLVLDGVHVGNFDLYFYVVCNAPALYIGSIYECDFDFMAIYSSQTKSDCPAIYTGAPTFRYNNAIVINTLKTEALSGPIIGGNGSLQEFHINNLFYEGSQQWAGSHIRNLQYLSSSTDKNKYETCIKVPLFKFVGQQGSSFPGFGVNIIIDNFSTENAGDRMWINTKDGDNNYKAVSLCELTSNSDIIIVVNNWIRTLMPYIFAKGMDGNGYIHRFIVNNYNNENNRGYLDDQDDVRILNRTPYIQADNIELDINNCKGLERQELPSVIDCDNYYSLVRYQTTKLRDGAFFYSSPKRKDGNIVFGTRPSYLITRDVPALAEYEISLFSKSSKHTETFEVRFYDNNTNKLVNTEKISFFIASADKYIWNSFLIHARKNCYFRIIRTTVGYPLNVKKITIAIK